MFEGRLSAVQSRKPFLFVHLAADPAQIVPACGRILHHGPNRTLVRKTVRACYGRNFIFRRRSEFDELAADARVYLVISLLLYANPISMRRLI